MNGTYNLVTECKAKSTSLFSVEAIVVVLCCVLGRNTALQGKIQGNLGDFDAQNDVSI